MQVLNHLINVFAARCRFLRRRCVWTWPRRTSMKGTMPASALKDFDHEMVVIVRFHIKFCSSMTLKIRQRTKTELVQFSEYIFHREERKFFHILKMRNLGEGPCLNLTADVIEGYNIHVHNSQFTFFKFCLNFFLSVQRYHLSQWKLKEVKEGSFSITVAFAFFLFVCLCFFSW